MIVIHPTTLGRAEVFEVEHSASYSQLAIGQTLIAIALELKKYNDQVDLDREIESHLIG